MLAYTPACPNHSLLCSLQQSLSMPMPILAQEYLAAGEGEKFKKPKQKKMRRKLRRKTKTLTADDLLEGAGDQTGLLGSRSKPEALVGARGHTRTHMRAQMLLQPIVYV